MSDQDRAIPPGRHRRSVCGRHPDLGAEPPGRQTPRGRVSPRLTTPNSRAVRGNAPSVDGREGRGPLPARAQGWRRTVHARGDGGPLGTIGATPFESATRGPTARGSHRATGDPFGVPGAPDGAVGAACPDQAGGELIEVRLPENQCSDRAQQGDGGRVPVGPVGVHPGRQRSWHSGDVDVVLHRSGTRTRAVPGIVTARDPGHGGCYGTSR